MTRCTPIDLLCVKVLKGMVTMMIPPMGFVTVATVITEEAWGKQSEGGASH